jgi:hypothetical protein
VETSRLSNDLADDGWSPAEEPPQQHHRQVECRDLWRHDRHHEASDLVTEPDSTDGYLGLTPEVDGFFGWESPANFANEAINAS